MRLAIALTVGLLLGATVSPSAQEPAPAQPDLVDSAPVFEVGSSEWMITGGPAFGVSLFHSEGGYQYFLQSVSWGRILTRALGQGVLRGRFQWSLEFIPLYGQYQPGDTYGVGVTPLTWRWNFEPRGKVAQFAELAGGVLWTRDPVPAETTTANFTAHISYGVRYFFKPRTAFVAGYRFHHISNGNRLERNPGVNAHVMQVGVSLMRPR